MSSSFDIKSVARFTVVAAVIIGLVINLPVRASGQSDLQKQIDAIVADAYQPDEPGAAIIAVRNGKTVYRGARGMAEMELGVALDPEMVFRLGSITKQFTAAAIMMLVEEGKLSLDDEITKFLPDYPTNEKSITVEHLLTHTSGIKSYTNIPGWMQKKVKEQLSVKKLIDGFKDQPMEFDPGKKFNYNNSGYVLLGAIIEEASGQRYSKFIKERIFEPLGMDQSYYGNHGRIIPKRVSGYDGRPSRPRNAAYLSMSQPYAAGSLLSNVDDLAKWNAALFSGKVVSTESLEKMITAYRLADGSSAGYGYGLVPSDLRGHTAISHGGGIFGFSTFGICLPDDDVYVAVLSNCTGAAIGPGRIGNQIAALVAGEPFPVFKETRVDQEILQKYAGVYRIDEDTTRIVTAKDGRLYTKRKGGTRLEAYPSSETEFFYKSSFTHFEFVLDDDGDVTGMRVYQRGSKNFELAERIADKNQTLSRN